MEHESVNEKISILYRKFKVKFDNLEYFAENKEIKNDKIRVLILDFNYIFDNAYGLSHSVSKNHMDLFDEKYIDLHVLHILSVIAHYRRFFFSRSKAKINYLFLFRSEKNPKRPWIIFDKIIDKLKNYTDFIPFFYVNDNIKKPRLFFKEMIEQEISKRNKQTANVHYYILTSDNLLKSFIFSLSNKYFDDSDLFVFTCNHMKYIMQNYKELYPQYRTFFVHEDKIIRKSFNENFYKLITIENLNIDYRKMRNEKKLKLLKKCFIDKTEKLENLLCEEMRPMYRDIIRDLLLNEMYSQVVHGEIINKEVKLYDKSILTMNMNIEDDNYQNIADWLFESEYVK